MTHTLEQCHLLRHDVRPRHGVADLDLAWCHTCHELLVPASRALVPVMAHPQPRVPVMAARVGTGLA